MADGLPAEPSGAPLLHRWFVLAMVVLVPAAIAVVVWAFLSISRPELEPAARRPPGDATITHERGDAALNRIRTAAPGPDCAAGVTVIGDDSARAASSAALEATCRVLRRGELVLARNGLDRWAARGGTLRVAVFEVTGLDSTARADGDQVVIELNAKFQFEAGARAAPALVHELTHLAQGMPGVPVTAEAELEAVRAQDLACDLLNLGEDPPRGCRDAAELLAEPDPLASLVEVGYPTSEGPE